MASPPGRSGTTGARSLRAPSAGARDPCALGRRLCIASAAAPESPPLGSRVPCETPLSPGRTSCSLCALGAHAPSPPQQVRGGRRRRGRTTGDRRARGLEGKRSTAPPSPPVGCESGPEPPPPASGKPRLPPPGCRLPSTLTPAAGRPTVPVGTSAGAERAPPLLASERQVPSRKSRAGATGRDPSSSPLPPPHLGHLPE